MFRDISTFIKQVCKSKQKLSVDDSLFFAEAKFTVKYLGKDKKIGLILKKENTGNFIYRWSIAGVNGLVENKMLDTTGNNGIRPVDHEMNFVQLRGILNNVSNNLANYRSYDVNIDPLSYFFALVKSKQIVVSQCDAVVYHCFCVKDFYFRIEKYNRNDYNSGWLISDFKKITEKEKLICINKLFDK